MEQLEHSMVAMYLEPYGYAAESAERWRDLPDTCPSRPQLALVLGGHSEKDRHTYYDVECNLKAEPTANTASSPLCLSWTKQRRLGKLREELHETVKNELGKNYSEVFASAPFAKRGGWAGTSDRLRKWLETLASCINEGAAPPALAAQVLLFFEAPALSKHECAAEVVQGLPEEASPQDLGTNSEAADPAGIAADRLEVLQQMVADVEADVEQMESKTSKSSEFDPPARQSAPSPPEIADSRVTEMVDAAEQKVEQQEPQPPDDVDSLATPSVAVNHEKDSDSNVAQDEGVPKSTETASPEESSLSQIQNFLAAYGFPVASLTDWCDASSLLGKPRLYLSLHGHEEVEGHTFYNLQCELVSEKPAMHLQWFSRHRLGQLREGLHDAVRDGLGKTYNKFFAQAPFARRGGLAGTSGRLHGWVEALAACVTAGAASPALVALVLRFLNVPGAPQPKAAKASTPRQRSQPVGAMESEPLPVIAPPVSREKKPMPEEQGLSEEQTENKRGRSQSPPSERGVRSDDETASAFSAGKRRAGYKKLREWFIELKKALDRKIRKDVN